MSRDTSFYYSFLVLPDTQRDAIVIGGETFIVQGQPLRDAERLVWTLEVRPA